jgi:hypothetical protein
VTRPLIWVTEIPSFPRFREVAATLREKAG